MTKKPLMYVTDEVAKIVELSTRVDKTGRVFFCVSFGDDYSFFEHLSSAIDYINSNFKA